MNENPAAGQPAYVYDLLREEAASLLTATGLVEPSAVTLATPKANIPADLAFPVFAAAKQADNMNPNEFAKKLAEAVYIPDGFIIGKVEAMGGFVNFAVEPEAFARAAVREPLTRGAAFGQDVTVGQSEPVVLEYSSPNIAKKMHVGHLRTTVIGHSLYRIFAALGYRVIGDNHLGDWGTQFGYLLAAIHEGNLTPWNDPEPINSLVKIYAEYYGASESDPAKKDAARAWFKKLEDGDPWARETWQRLIDLTLEEFSGTYERLGITFDTMLGESYFEPVLDDVIQEAVTKGVAKVEPGGAVSVDFGDKLPSCLLRKTDGATLYQTRDVATCIYRWREYQPVRNIYVVGAEQKLHFQQVFEITRRMGYSEIADRSVHISFGMVTKATGERFSARKGEAIYLEEVLDESITRARVKIREQIAAGKTELTESELESAAEMLGIGAVIYADLYQGPERNIQFDWDTMLNPDGNTATYIQYTHARCKSILRKAGDADTVILNADLDLLTEPEAQATLKQLHRLPHAVREAGDKYLPATVADWTYNLAKEFARFYDKCPVLNAPSPELRAARLALVAAVGQGLKNGLYLLGIEAPERM
jgi:arginyl-tRNA synthetase